MLKNYLLSPLCSTSAPHLSPFQLSFSFNFSATFFCFSLLVSASFFCFFSSGQHLFLLLFSSPSAPLFFFMFFCFIPLSLAPLSSFLLDMLPFFISPKIFFSAQNLFLLQSKTFFQPKTFLPQPKILFQFSQKILFSAQNVFALAQDTFSVQPKNLSLFVVQRLLLFVSFLPAFLFCL